jgi:hypothetical protein
MNYCKNLKYNERPDYNFLKVLFIDLLYSRYEEKFLFDWTLNPNEAATNEKKIPAKKLLHESDDEAKNNNKSNDLNIVNHGNIPVKHTIIESHDDDENLKNVYDVDHSIKDKFKKEATKFNVYNIDDVLNYQDEPKIVVKENDNDKENDKPSNQDLIDFKKDESGSIISNKFKTPVFPNYGQDTLEIKNSTTNTKIFNTDNQLALQMNLNKEDNLNLTHNSERNEDNELDKTCVIEESNSDPTYLQEKLKELHDKKSSSNKNSSNREAVLYLNSKNEYVNPEIKLNASNENIIKIGSAKNDSDFKINNESETENEKKNGDKLDKGGKAFKSISFSNFPNSGNK